MEQPLVKLKALYKFLEQLYVGGSYCVIAMKNTKARPRFIKDMLKELSMVPEWIKELKKSACRQGALTALARAKAYFPELVPAQIVSGFPEFNVDGTPFEQKDFLHCIKENRVAATQLAEEAELKKFQATYTEAGKCVGPPTPQPFELNLPSKQVFAPGINSSTVMQKESVSEALDGIQWLAEDGEASQKGQEEPAKDDSATIRPEDLHINPESSNAGAQ